MSIINLVAGCVVLLLHHNIEAASHSNILLIIVDDLRPALGCYGDAFSVTPYIDSIAKSGILFDNAFAQQALCGPSRTSFLTSRRPDTTKLVDVHSYWRRNAGNFTSLPQYFKERGYHTVNAGKVFHPGIVSNYNDDQPYSWSELPFHPSTQSHKQDPVCLGNDEKLHTSIYCPVQILNQPGKTLPDIQTTEFSLEWLKKWKRKIIRRRKKIYFSRRHMFRRNPIDQPFLLAVGFHKPHIPLKFPVEFLDLYPINKVPLAPNNKLPDGLPLVAWNPWNDLRRRDDIKALNLSFPLGPIPDSYARYIRQGYYAATSYTDSLVGSLVARARSLFPDTIIALVGDHGWSLGEHQEWSKFSNYEVSTRVPFIVSLPDQNDNLLKADISKDLKHFQKQYVEFFKRTTRVPKDIKKYDGIVELVDLFPTLVDLAGLKILPKCPTPSNKIKTCTEGISLSCIIYSCLNPEKDNEVHRCPVKLVALSQYPRPGPHPTLNPDSDQPRLKDTTIMGYSMRTPYFRYTAWLPFNHSTFKVVWENLYGEELYIHPWDESEDNNIIFNVLQKSKYRNYLKQILKDPRTGTSNLFS